MTRDQLKELKLSTPYFLRILKDHANWDTVMPLLHYEDALLVITQILNQVSSRPRFLHGPLVQHGVELLSAKLPEISSYEVVCKAIARTCNDLTQWTINPEIKDVPELIFLMDFPNHVRTFIDAIQALCLCTTEPNKILHFAQEIIDIYGEENEEPNFSGVTVLRKHIPDLSPYVATARLLSR